MTPPLILLSPSWSGKQVRRSERERCLLSSGTKTAYRCTYLKTICDRSEASMRYNERSTTCKLNQEYEWERKKDCLTCHETTGEPVWRRPSFISFSNPFHSFTHTCIHSFLLFHRFPSHFFTTCVPPNSLPLFLSLFLHSDLLHSSLFIISFSSSIFVTFTCMHLINLTLTSTLSSSSLFRINHAHICSTLDCHRRAWDRWFNQNEISLKLRHNEFEISLI